MATGWVGFIPMYGGSTHCSAPSPCCTPPLFAEIPQVIHLKAMQLALRLGVEFIHLILFLAMSQKLPSTEESSYNKDLRTIYPGIIRS